ncbi:unnamed protein product [Caenorhabditis angaria]|uniref:SANT domain-containing protein n=1 Tax=Caenorhabditis angaria TaxID=860376 RepID=A0A9P1IB04_9PELO|nr:unnamed protein product [Caenorhabditis angaria]
MEDELSRSSLNDEDDYDDTLDNDNGEDYEATIEEDEQFEGGDYEDELKDLEDENEMSIEELKKKYGYPAQEEIPVGNLSDEEEEEEEAQGTSTLEMINNLDEDDDDYNPPDPFRKEIRVDQQKYQAEVDDFSPEAAKTQDDVKGSRHEEPEVLLWSNKKNLSDEKIDEYLKSVVELRIAYEQNLGGRGSKDDEDALCVLLRHDFDVEEAKNAFPFPRVNYAYRTVRPDALSFDEKESKMFEEAIEKYGKDFSLIRRLILPYRTVGELVEYYYQWKLTPFYRTWRDAHPQHVPVIQPHITAAQI